MRALLLGLLAAPFLFAGSVQLAWDPNAPGTITGYNIYTGTSDGFYTGFTDVGNVTAALIDNLAPSTTYFFVATAYLDDPNFGRLESPYSNQVSYTMAAATPTPTPDPSATPTPTPTPTPDPSATPTPTPTPTPSPTPDPSPTPTPTPTPSPTPTPPPTPSSTLANISTRGFVQTGDNVLIGGFIIHGSGPLRVIVRAIGPSLVAYGLQALADPTLELHDGLGGLIYQNDNWQSNQQAEIIATGLAPIDIHESAIVQTLQPGNYTAIVRGVNSTTGVALIEVYNLESP